MKNTLLLLLLIPFLGLSQDLSVNNLPKKLAKKAPGTIKISDQLSIDKRPVDESMYQEFLQSIQSYWNDERSKEIRSNSIQEILGSSNNGKMNQPLFTKMLPTALKSLDVDKAFKENNSSLFEVATMHNPVVGISKEQAATYCKWRTDMLFITQKNDKRWSDVTTPIYTYRLATEEELTMATAHFEEKNRINVILTSPSQIAPTSAKSYLSSNDYQVFKNSSVVEITSESSENESNIFRCVCEVNYPEKR
ncbi:MAG: SUMF1/EgtB/PvdO family nonheme iron enzyme [Nonlabens sp.]|uniref:SUMF1/EgtB/PvdO family nonheme iron enzyme n=1 Tax=Nonlabens sp. TaxID=1888209 RepID=UPI003EF7CB81